MIVDIHTHAFPDGIAKRAIASLIQGARGAYPPCTDGTVSGLARAMDAFGVDVSVVQPVVTKPSQTKTLNLWAKEIESEHIVSFGGIHPDTDDFRRDIDYVVSLGIKGLKFHAEYQGFVADEPRMLKIYDYALEKGLILLHHGGCDPAFKPPFRSSPKMFKNIVRQMRGGTIIVAHLGGHDQWDEVECELVGENVLLDTSMGFDYYGEERFLSVVKAHGADKILFGSDSPWSRADKEIDRIKNLPLSDLEKKAILGENAKKLLKL